VIAASGEAFPFDTIADGESLVRDGDSIGGTALTASAVGAVPDVHTDDEQLALYSGGWGALDVGAAGKVAIQAVTAEQLRAASASTKTWQKTAAPTVNADSSAGYVAGDLWNDTTNNRTYVADSVAVGAADWRSLLTANGIRWLIRDGSLIFIPTFTNADGTTVDVGAEFASSASADPSAWGISLTSNGLSFPGGKTGSSTAVSTSAQYWGLPIAAMGLQFPTSPYRLSYGLNITGQTGVRGGASINAVMLASVGGYSSLQRGAGLNAGTTGTNFNPTWLGTAGSGLFSNVSGSATCLGVVGQCVQLGNYTQANRVHKVEGGIITSEYDGPNGYTPATQFTHLALWANITSATVLTNTLTLDGVTGWVRWGGLS